MANTPNKSDGNFFSAGNMFKHVVNDNALAGVVTTQAETEIGEATVAANAVSAGILILAQVETKPLQNDAGANASNTITIKIRVGENATATSNALAETYTFRLNQQLGQANDSDSAVQVTYGNTVMAWYTAATWSNENFVHITGASDDADDDGSYECKNIVVMGF